MASLYKTYLQREEYIYKKSTFQGFYKSSLYLSPEFDPLLSPSPCQLFSAQLNGPKSTQMQLKSVKTGQQFNSSCTQNHVQLFTTFHTMKEF